MAGRQPDYRIAALRRSAQGQSGDYKNNSIGAAWINDNGSITIKIDAFVVLQGGPDLVVTMFRNEEKPSGQKSPERNALPFDDDRPF